MTKRPARSDDSMFRALVEQSKDILYQCDREGVFTYCSPSVRPLFGYAPEELIGTNVREHVHPDQLPQLEERIVQVLSGERLRLNEICFRRKDGTYLPVEVNSAPHFVDGEIIGVLGVARDITERKEAEATIRESERRFRELVEHMPVGVVQTTVEGEFLYMNEYAMRTVGFRSLEEAAAEGGVPGRYKHQGDRDKTIGLLLTDGRFDNYPVELLTKSNETIDVLVSAKIVDGVITGILLDITELKQAEAKLLKSQRQLRALAGHLQSIREDERKRVAREIHDELGQSLTALNIDLTWLGNHVADLDRTLLDKVNKMTTLVEGNIKTVKRIAAELRPGVLDDLGLTSAVEWQAGEFESRTKIPVRLSIEPEHFTLDSDLSTTIFRLFQEALTNVARHAAADHVEARLVRGDDRIELVVADDGRGITREQIESPLSIGLVGMRERVHPWGGEVRLEGRTGEGTTVTVNIPLEKEDPTS